MTLTNLRRWLEQDKAREIVTVPLLRAGRHLNPSRGACLMELTSVYAEETWTDRPACVQGTLAGVARAVNDAMSDQERSSLIPLVPFLANTASNDPRAAAAVALVCLRAAAANRNVSPSRRLLAALDRASAAVTTPVPADSEARARAARKAHRRLRRPTRVALRVVGKATTGPDRDTVLHQILLEAVNQVRRTALLPAVNGDLLPMCHSTRIRVRRNLTPTFDGDMSVLRCTLVDPLDAAALFGDVVTPPIAATLGEAARTQKRLPASTLTPVIARQPPLLELDVTPGADDGRNETTGSLVS